MREEVATTEPRPNPTVLEVFEEFIRTREFQDPPAAAYLAEQLPDEDSKESFQELIDSYEWTQDLLPRNVLPNVVLADRFRLIERLGVGGMGQVWRAVDQKLGREVAVKVMSLIGTVSMDAEAAFERETHLLAQLRHPDIVNVVDSDRDEEHRFLVMELLEGKSLDLVLADLAKKAQGVPTGLSARDILDAIDTKLEAGHTPLLSDESYSDAVAKILAEALRTLEAAHARLIVHRDLKPGNIMLSAGGQPKLMDFGLGGMVGGTQGDLTGSLFGTFRFVAPEQLLRGRAGTDVRTDIYQLGIVLYEFLTLRKCFDSEDHAELFHRISKGRFEQPRAIDKAIPRDLEDVCLRAIDLNPAHRYQTAAEFREALDRFLRREPVHPDRYGPVDRVWRRMRYVARRHRPVLIGVAAVLLASVLTWLARDAIAESVRLEAVAVTSDEFRGFKLTADEARHLVGIYRIRLRENGQILYRPAAISAGGFFASELLLKAGTHELQARVPGELRGVADVERLTCELALDAEYLGKLRRLTEEMRARMVEERSVGVTQAWMDKRWRVRSATDVGPDIPLEAFLGEGYTGGRVVVKSVEWSRPK